MGGCSLFQAFRFPRAVSLLVAYAPEGVFTPSTPTNSQHVFSLSSYCISRRIDLPVRLFQQIFVYLYKMDGYQN